MEGLLTDVSVKEEDREIDIASYSTETVAEPAAVVSEAEEAGQTEQIQVDVDKVYKE